MEGLSTFYHQASKFEARISFRTGPDRYAVGACRAEPVCPGSSPLTYNRRFFLQRAWLSDLFATLLEYEDLLIS